MKLDKHLNLVSTVKRSDNSRIFIHSTPISAEVYRTYWRPLSLTFADIMGTNLVTVGPRVALMVLQEVAEKLGIWDTRDGVKAGLLAEIHRLTNAFVLGKSGWEMMPLEDALKSNLLDDEDFAEAEGRLIFFTAGFHTFLRETRREMLAGALQHWNAQISPLSCTEFMTSLQTSTEAENSGATAAD